ERRRKYKMRKLMQNISPIDLTELMKLTLKENENQLQKHLNFWLGETILWNKKQKNAYQNLLKV
ncbi:hypothetical protein BUY26_12825, partial [Staphylococcus cohnii]